MSLLAKLIYLYLLNLLAADKEAWANYKPIALRLRPEHRLSWRGGPMHEALGEIVLWCQSCGLPALPAIVVRLLDGYPGDGFYVVAFPGVHDPHERRRLWRAEVESVRRTAFPLPN
jgi:hypothetical protein